MPCDLVPHFQVLHSPVLHFQRTPLRAEELEVSVANGFVDQTERPYLTFAAEDACKIIIIIVANNHRRRKTRKTEIRAVIKHLRNAETTRPV